MVIIAGIDSGTKNTKTVIMRDGRIIGSGLTATGFDQVQAVKKSLESALKEASISLRDLTCISGTGSGVDAILEADVTVNEMKAISVAAHYFFPSCRIVADIGAEETRVVRFDERGRVEDFTVNARCAAGAGAFIEAMARALETPVESMGKLALTSSNPIHLNAQCVIFAESEVVGLIHANVPKNDIIMAIHDAVGNRIASMIRRLGTFTDMVLVGGVARNQGVVEAVKRELDIHQVFVPEKPEFAAAVGAAVVAARD